MKISFLLTVSIALLCCNPTHGTIIVNGNSGDINTMTSFTQQVVAKAYYPLLGTTYVGLNLANSTTPGAFTVSQFARPATTTQLKFTGIAPGDLQNKAIDFLSVVPIPGRVSPLLSAVPVLTAGELTQKTVYVFGTGADGFVVSQQSVSILGTNTVNGANGGITQGIAGITSNDQYVFIATFTNTEVGGFGTLESGIAVLNINENTQGSVTTLALNQVAAVPNDTGIKAVVFDATSPAITTNVPFLLPPQITNDRISMYWDFPLERLYLGIQVSTSGFPGAGAKSVVMGYQQQNEQGELNLATFLPNAALVVGDATNIVGALQGVTQLSLAANHLQVMHCSTGPSYLILNGGNGTITLDSSVGGGTTGNNIWALPLVDVQNPANPAQGLLANKNVFNTATHRFTTPAAANADLTTTNDLFAKVGGGPLPQQPATPIWGVGSGSVNSSGIGFNANSLDIVVAGDTVYVAIATPQTDNNDTGVFYSQAMYDEQGKINRWTPWAKRAVPFDAFVNIPENKGRVRFVSPDPVTGKIVAVEGTNGQAVRMSSFDQGMYATTLNQLVSAALPNGSFSVLDLDQTTVGLASSGPSRYALFGGTNRVAFAQTTISRTPFPGPYAFTAGSSTIPASQKLATYFNNTGNFNPASFLVTELPSSAGGIQTLQYSRQIAGTANNYFFAGSNSGLYVFADAAGNGFDVDILGTFLISGALNAPPFSTGSWRKIGGINGSVTALRTTGKTLYMLTTQLQGTTLISRVFNIPYTTNVSTMFAPGNISLIAQSGVNATGSNLSAAKEFTDIQILSTINDNSQEQLVLATNNGLYMSNTLGGSQGATTQTTAAWALIPGSANTFFTSIGAIDTPAATTAWPISLANPNKCNVFNRSIINQLNGGTLNTFAFVPTPFNAADTQGIYTNLQTLDYINYFTSDGFRRFFSAQQPTNIGTTGNSLEVLPYQNTLNGARQPTVIFDGSLAFNRFYYWISPIGGTGLTLAGTNRGVAALD